MTAMSIELKSLSKHYNAAEQGEFCALRQVSLVIEPGTATAIVGRSGSGKSTLLNIIAGLDRATDGEIFIGGHAIHRMTENELALWRGKHVGVVFQFFQLLPTLSIVENILLGMDFVNIIPRKERRARAMALLEKVGIADQAKKLPSQLSGGQQQRVAIARALANDPPLLVADEPTGNLDTATSWAVIELLRELSGQKKTLIVVTHDEHLAQRMQKIIRFADGRVIDIAPPKVEL